MANQNPSKSTGEQAKKGQPQQKPQEGQTEEKREQQGAERTAQPGPLARREAAPLAAPGMLGGFGASPFGLMRRMMEDMDRLFDDFGGGRGFLPSLLGMGRERQRGLGLGLTAWAPRVEVFERDGSLMLRAELPGMGADEIDIYVTDDSLVLEGERQYGQREERGGMLRTERSYGVFRREIPLPEGVDVEDIAANLDNGVLEIEMKLPEERKGRRIEVQSSKKAEAGEQQQQAQGGEMH